MTLVEALEEIEKLELEVVVLTNKIEALENKYETEGFDDTRY